MKQTVTSGRGETVDMIQPAHSRTPGPVPYDLHVALGAKTEVVSRSWAQPVQAGPGPPVIHRTPSAPSLGPAYITHGVG